MSESEAKCIEINETDCDNPISLDEIEKGLWLGVYHFKIKLEIYSWIFNVSDK